MRRTRSKKTAEVRVTAGVLKGRRLSYPEAGDFRPTMQAAKMAVFNHLGRLDGCVFCDLFAAAGGIGIEAASRGAGVIHFVESARKAVEHLRINVEACRIDGCRFVVHEEDAFDFILEGKLQEIRPTVIFADPPYGEERLNYLLELLSEKSYDWLHRLIIEHDGRLEPEAAARLREMKRSRFGRSMLSFFEPARGGET
jgi:16S rRNA (guanine966-N2)-methyltransferase